MNKPISKDKSSGLGSFSPPSEGLGEALSEFSYDLRGEEYIELIKLLKIMRISESGGQAKQMVDDGIVFRNGEPEFRKRAKLRSGDLIEVFDFRIQIE
jgi:ribosome-associated protein